MIKTANGLVEYAKSQLGKPYWYGTFGQISSQQVLNMKSKQYPKYYTDTDFKRQFGQKVHDCVGLIKGYLWSDDVNSSAIYNPSQDVSAKTMYNISVERGSINDFEPVNGTLLYKGTKTAYIHHVGVYADGYVIEAKGHKYGVVKTKFKKTDWQFWSKCNWIDYDIVVDNTIDDNEHIKYTIKKNDTLAKIAKKYNTTVDELVRLNDIENKNLIIVGDIITIK